VLPLASHAEGHVDLGMLPLKMLTILIALVGLRPAAMHVVEPPPHGARLGLQSFEQGGSLCLPRRSGFLGTIGVILDEFV
jgi:hypothetical protein